MKILFLIIIYSYVSFAFSSEYSLEKTVYKTAKIPFIEHVGKGKFSNYLALNIPYAPVKKLFDEIEKREDLKLISRGEAHITVITPIEYNNLLKNKIDITELNQMARKASFQSLQYEAKCLGSGTLKVKDKDTIKEKTFYIVVASKALLKFREGVEELYLKRGGKDGKFKASDFYPHITVGFLNRDLHESDGVIKSEKSCYADLNMLL